MMMATERRPILLANARIIDPSRDFDIEGDLLLADGVIREAKRGIGAAGAAEGTEVSDEKRKVFTPGLVDMRAFIGEPGAEYRETIASASQAAAAGGVTTIVSQPDTSPAIDDPAIVDFVLRRARRPSIVHVQPMAALTKGLRGEEMAEIGLLKAAGAVAFTDGARSVTNAQVMRRALTYARDFDALVVHHTEDPDIVGEGVMNEGEFAARLGLTGVPTAAETIMLERDLRLVALTESRYHAASPPPNETAGAPSRPSPKPSPPLRAEDDRTALVAALASGLIDVVMSDHNPQDVETKRLPFAAASPGALGLETVLTAGLRLVHSGELALMTFLKAMSSAPAKILGLAAGTLRQGSPADVIVLDPDVPWVLDPAELKSKCKNTPFDEAKLEGRVVRTIVAGRTVYEYV